MQDFIINRPLQPGDKLQTRQEMLEADRRAAEAMRDAVERRP